MSIEARNGWNRDGAGSCLGCGRPTAASMVIEEQRVPVCPECSALSRADWSLKALLAVKAAELRPATAEATAGG